MLLCTSREVMLGVPDKKPKKKPGRKPKKKGRKKKKKVSSDEEEEGEDTEEDGTAADEEEKEKEKERKSAFAARLPPEKPCSDVSYYTGAHFFNHKLLLYFSLLAP